MSKEYFLKTCIKATYRRLSRRIVFTRRTKRHKARHKRRFHDIATTYYIPYRHNRHRKMIPTGCDKGRAHLAKGQVTLIKPGYIQPLLLLFK